MVDDAFYWGLGVCLLLNFWRHQLLVSLLPLVIIEGVRWREGRRTKNHAARDEIQTILCVLEWLNHDNQSWHLYSILYTKRVCYFTFTDVVTIEYVTPRDHCARCLLVFRRRCLVICLRVAFCHVIMCIASSCFSKLASIQFSPVLSVVRSEPRHTCTCLRHVPNIIL